MSKLTGFILGGALMLGMGAASAGETPEILGAVDYQAMSKAEMSRVTGENHISTTVISVTQANNQPTNCISAVCQFNVTSQQSSTTTSTTTQR